MPVAETKSTSTSNAAVAARSIVWARDLTEQQKSDVLESTLFAQAAADKQGPSDSEDNTLAWYKTYVGTLERIGWVVQTSVFSEVQTDKAQGSVYDAMLDSLGPQSSVSTQDTGLLTSVLRAMLAYSRAGSDSAAAQVLNQSSIASSSHFASFQIAIASGDGQNVVLTLVACFYACDQNVGDALWFSWENATLDMQISKLEMTLNEDIYAQVRATIHEKLADSHKFDGLVPM